MGKPSSYDMSQRGLDRTLIRAEERERDRQFVDLDDFDSQVARDAYVRQNAEQFSNAQIREARRQGKVKKAAPAHRIRPAQKAKKSRPALPSDFDRLIRAWM